MTPATRTASSEPTTGDEQLAGTRLRLREFPGLVWQAAIAWWNDNAFRLAASLAFYTIFSIAPLMLLTIVIAGLLFGEEIALRHLAAQVSSLVGEEGGRVVEQLVASLRSAEGGPVAAVIGVASVLLGSTAVFAELQSALNQIWDVSTETTRGTVTEVVRRRALSLMLVLGIGFLLLVSLVLDAVVAGARDFFEYSASTLVWFWPVAQQILSLAITTLLFMMIYKILPDVRLSWSDVAIGALFTAILFTIGKYLIGLYLGRMAVGNAYGAAGSFVVLLIWVYYSALISFFGAEFTLVYARRMKGRIKPEDHAVRRHEKVV